MKTVALGCHHTCCKRSVAPAPVVASPPPGAVIIPAPAAPRPGGEVLGSTGRAEAIVCVGAGVTNVVVHENGVPRFVRVLLVG